MRSTNRSRACGAIQIRHLAHLVVALVGILAAILGVVPTNAFAAGVNPDAVKALQKNIDELVQLAVQRAVSSLPTATPQSIRFDYDPETDSFVRSARVPPSIFQTPDTTPIGQLELRTTISYFKLRDLTQTSTYSVIHDAASFDLRVSAEARTSVFTVALSYGLLRNTDVNVLLPVSAVQENVDVLASDLYTGKRSTGFKQLSQSDDDTKVGLGRVAISVKSRVLREEWIRAAFASTFDLPSPNSQELAGVGSAAWGPTLIAEFPLVDFLKFEIDAGYSLDFAQSDRRYFGYNAGFSFSWPWISADVGSVAQFYNSSSNLFAPSSCYQIGDECFPFGEKSIVNLGKDLVDIRFGLKVPIAHGLWLAGIATVPVSDVQFRPSAIGTLSLEVAL